MTVNAGRFRKVSCEGLVDSKAWEKLQEQLSDSITSFFTSGNSHPSDRRGLAVWSDLREDMRPAAVVRCNTLSDASAAVEFAQKYGNCVILKSSESTSQDSTVMAGKIVVGVLRFREGKGEEEEGENSVGCIHFIKAEVRCIDPCWLLLYVVVIHSPLGSARYVTSKI
mmetsp:Transcript_28230/g.47850  ORF Transcript_28230/g.47850 Transcript_28230/m.47850 type:complete len:168 (-) Transcript_28230:446-949(-)